MPAKTLPVRSQVKPADCWNLSSLFATDAAWEKAFRKWTKLIPRYAEYEGTLADGPQALAACLDFDNEFERFGERLSTYAFLKTAEDQGNGVYQKMLGRYRHFASQAGQTASFLRPEIMAIPAAKLKKYLAAKELAPHALALTRILRYQPHTLSPEGEKLLAMQAEMTETPNQVFRQLNDADLKFGLVTNERGEQVELGTSSFSALLHSPAREVRQKAFHQFYGQYAAHANAFAATLAGAVHRDVFQAKSRGYPSAREHSLFHDHVPVSVYDNLISAVRKKLHALHRYYELRRRKMKLKTLHHYDTYVPILSERQVKHSWAEAVKLMIDSLQPLGSDYCGALEKGLNNGWCDRYPNRGKQSGAFSSGSYDGEPYILMNYQPEVLDHVFTLAHEAGHSLHSYLSARHQPFQYYNYVIFVAEVASTFNEQLLGRHLADRAADDGQRAFLINREIDAIRGTIFRQAMFAEFEKRIHANCEAGEPLTLDSLKSLYRELLTAYFGPKFALDDCLALECLRIPHFYRAFYVYKYATGLSAAIALSERVLNGGAKELEAYLGFLKGGCSLEPLDLLRGAGVDLEKPAAVDAALARFEKLVAELDELL